MAEADLPERMTRDQQWQWFQSKECIGGMVLMLSVFAGIVAKVT